MTIKHIISAVALIVSAGAVQAQSSYAGGGFGQGGVAHTPSSVEQYYATQAYNRDVNMRNTLNSHQAAQYGNGRPVVDNPVTKPALPGTQMYILQQKNINAVQQREIAAQNQARLQAIQASGARISGVYVAPVRH